MKIKVYSNRQLMNETNYYGSTYENLATTLNFEFPEKVTKDGEEYLTADLNKYIVFEDDSQDLIVDDKYSFPYAITSLGHTVIYIKMMENSSSDDVSDKLIWYSEGLPITFNTTKEGTTEITSSKIDAFNTLYSELNTDIAEVNDLKAYQEQFKADVEAGKYNGKDGEDGKTPVKGTDYFTDSDIEEFLKKVLDSDTIKDLVSRISDLENTHSNNTFIIIEKED